MDLGLINKHWKDDVLYPFPEKRNLYTPLTHALSKRFITSLIGLRRTGKTTLLKQLINFLIEQGTSRSNILLFSFDELSDLADVIKEYLRVTSKDLDDEQLYFFLDEIQKLPDWQNKIKIYYDHYPNLKFIISGSSSLFLRKKSESLAGRIQEFWLPPLSFGEFLQFRGKKELIAKKDMFAAELSRELEIFAERQFIDIIHETKDNAYAYIETLVKKIVFEDIPQVYPVEQPQLLLRIFKIIACNPGMLLDYHSLASDLGMNEKTLANYIHYLEMAFLIKKVYNYSPNQLTSEKKLKKVYPAASSFCQIDIPRVIESLVITQLNCQFFWKRSHEVDCILVEKNEIVPLEVKYREHIPEKELKGLQQFMKLFSTREGVVLTKNHEGREKHISSVPVWKWLLQKT